MKITLIVLGLIVAVFAVVGAIAPTDLEIEREVVIQKPKDVVFSTLKFMKNHGAWSPWQKRDPNIVMDFKGTDGTVGAISTWSGNNEVGVGEQEIKNIAEGDRIDYELRFKKPMEDTSAAYLITESVDASQTRVRWGMKGKTPFPANVFCFVMNMRKKLRADLDEGLAALKLNLEK